MVDVAQLAEHWTVAPVVAGSRPVIHPIPYSQQYYVTFVFHVCQELEGGDFMPAASTTLSCKT